MCSDGTHSLILAGSAAETTRLLAYWVLAIASVGAALGMVLARKAVHCALMLAVVMLSLAVFYAWKARRSSPSCRSSSTPAQC